MCGIAGAYFHRTSRPVEPALVRRMCGRIVHRGPDDEGVHVDGNLGIGMRRLSIIDLAGGRQPVFNEDGSIAVVFNGEIYNFLELRRDLESRGHRFSTRTDTEAIVHLYEELGDEFPSRLNGMFAIALWDAVRRRLVIVRDRLGVKPLYYASTADGLVFGSELKCVLEDTAVGRDLDPEALYHYFTLGYIPHPQTAFRSVRQLPPGCRMVVEAGRPEQIDRYWTLDARVDRSLDRDEVQDSLCTLLADAVRIRMISDVPLGAFLSGGLDSSITVALMARESAAPVKTFHIDFDEPRYSERRFARAVAERYGTDHHELVVRPSAVDVLDRLIDAFDEPFADSSAIPTWYVSQLTRQHVTVALAGDGGDESFGGYSRYQRILRRRRLPRVVRATVGEFGGVLHRMLPRKAPGKRYLRALSMDHPQFYAVGTAELESRELFTRDFLDHLGEVSTYELLREGLQTGDQSDVLSPYASLDLRRYLPDDILTKVDRTSMAHALEVRAPFLDYRVVELAARIPGDWKIRGRETKVILKRACGHLLPPEVLEPRKRGFSVPLGHWLNLELRPMLEEAVSDSALVDAGILRGRELRGLMDEHHSCVRDRSAQLWRFLVAERWWRRWQADLACGSAI